MKKVVKFGGSSLASAEQFKKVGAIISADESRVYVVPSAPGKRFPEDTKVTDMLLHVYETAKAGEDITEEMKAIKARYDEIITGLALKDFSLDKDFEEITKKLVENPQVDYAASRGEFLNGKIMAAYLGVEFIDAAEVIFFNAEGNLNSYKTEKVLSERLSKAPRAVVPGFYGLGKDGNVKTFSRGGSDVTGSIVAQASQADVYENWTDVSGFLVAESFRIQSRSNILLTESFVSFLIWEHRFCTKMRFSLSVTVVYRSISGIQMYRKIRVHGLLRAHARSRIML